MPISSKPIKWLTRPAKELRPGDCIKDGYGPGTENWFATVARVEMAGRGIVLVWTAEALPFVAPREYGEEFPVEVASEPAIDERKTRLQN